MIRTAVLVAVAAFYLLALGLIGLRRLAARRGADHALEQALAAKGQRLRDRVATRTAGRYRAAAAAGLGGVTKMGQLGDRQREQRERIEA